VKKKQVHSPRTMGEKSVFPSKKGTRQAGHSPGQAPGRGKKGGKKEQQSEDVRGGWGLEKKPIGSTDKNSTSVAKLETNTKGSLKLVEKGNRENPCGHETNKRKGKARRVTGGEKGRSAREAGAPKRRGGPRATADHRTRKSQQGQQGKREKEGQPYLATPTVSKEKGSGHA